MDVKRLVLLSLFVLISACTTSAGIVNQERLYFSNYALAICLGSSFKAEDVKADFNKSANGYMERGNIPIEAFEELRGLVDTWLEKNYPSKHGGQINSAKCFDLYHSSELTSLFEKYDPCGTKDSWLSSDDYEKSCKSSITKSSTRTQ